MGVISKQNVVKIFLHNSYSKLLYHFLYILDQNYSRSEVLYGTVGDEVVSLHYNKDYDNTYYNVNKLGKLPKNLVVINCPMPPVTDKLDHIMLFPVHLA
jgi:hypothetical protein